MEEILIGEIQEKCCGRCGMIKNISEFRVRHDKRSNPILVYPNNNCYSCEAELQRERAMRQRSTHEGRANHNRWANEFHKRHRPKILVQQKERRNRPGAKEKRKQYDIENAARIRELSRIRNRRYIAKMIEEQPEKYAIKKLSEQTGVPKNVFIEHPEIVKAKTVLLNIKRKIKHHGN